MTMSSQSNMLHLGLFCLLIAYSGNYVESARILGVFQFPSYSHQVVYQQIWRELSLRGHEVIVVTPNPINDPSLTNVTEIDVGYIKNLMSSNDELQESMSKDDPTPQIMKAFYHISLVFQEAILKDEQFSKIYNNPKEKFDLILMECLHPGMYSLSGKFGAPIIGVSSLGVPTAIHESVGNTNHPVIYPDMNLHNHFDLSLKDKLYSIYFTLFLHYYYKYKVIPDADEVSRKYLGDVPYLGDLAKNVSLLFLNTNNIIHNIRPNVPKIVQLGQMHIRPPKKLPKDVQEILDSSKQDVIYFSLGSNVKSVNIDGKLKNIIVETMAELPYTFLWKWEADHFPEKPNNVYIRSWFPQQDVLAHPKVKLFVTQGGLQSIEEAISRAVPMIGMPFIGDQPMNVNKIQKAGIAIALDPIKLSKETFKKSILEIMNNNKYRNNIKEVRYQIEDQPMSGLERAVWWSEYVIRNKGAAHLHSPTADIPWWKFLLLDVIGATLLILFTTVYILLKLFKALVAIISYVPKDKDV